jgi:DNA polymerase III, epsilon subunit and related 3''-5'' exonucleases
MTEEQNGPLPVRKRYWRKRREEPKQHPVYIPSGHLSDFVAIDFEAANAAFTSACSMGLVIVHDNAIAERYYGLMKPVPNRYDWYNIKVHGIKKTDTDKAPSFPYLWTQVGEVELLCGSRMLFDQHVLRALHELYKIPYPDYPFYCTHEGSKKYLPDLENHKLPTVAKHFGFDMEQRHNALTDAEACAVIAMNIF